MRVMVTAPGEQGPRHLVVHAPDGASVDDLHAVLGLPAAPGGRTDTTVPLQHGYAVGARSGASRSPCPVRLVVVSGPDAGRSAPLLPGRWVTVGRSASCDVPVLDPALSRQHVRVRHERSGVVVEDLGSTNGLRWDGQDASGSGEGASGSGEGASVPGPSAGPAALPGTSVPWPTCATLEVGSSRLALVLEPLPPAAGRERDGRLRVTLWSRQVPEVEPVRLSSPPVPRPREVRAPSAWVWALPLVASVAIALVLRMPMVLLFGLMAPAMVMGHHLGERRSSRLDHKHALRDHVADLQELSRTAAAAVTHDLVSRRRRHPGVLGVTTALVPWPTTELWTRAGEPPTVVLGEASVPSSVELDGTLLAHDAAPLVLDLSRPVVVIGPQPERAGAVRSWVLQLASGHPPSEVTLAVDPAALPGPGWDLLAWLPHTRPGTASRTAVRIAWDRADGLLLLDDARDAPAGVTQVLLADGTSGVLRRPGHPDVPFRPTLVGMPLARHLCRTLAALDHDGPESVPTGPATLGDLVPWPTGAEQVRRGWASPTAGLSAPVGTDRAGGTVVLDLVRDGPHALVAGTTGSGKSELLRTLVTALALRHPPSRLSLLLIDYKGGSSLGECAALPHSTGLVTDLDPHLAERVLVSLRAELRRREAVLAAADVRDARDYGGPDLPRLLVVIDEFRVLAEELPEFLDGLVRLAAVGRSLGVHLVLATQRPAGVVSADLRANVNLRIALRVRDAADSLDVLDVPDAAALPEGRPGLALLRTGSSPPRAVQVAPTAPAAATEPRAAWVVEQVDGVWSGWARLHAPATRGQQDGGGEDSGLADLPGLLTSVAGEDGDRCRRVWQPPLGEVVTLRTPGAWALADRPELQRHEPVTWDGSTHVGVVGAARTGRTTAVRSLVAAAGPAWLYVLDLARGLEGTELRRHPGLRSWVGPHDPAHAVRVLEVVGEVLDDRLARGSTRDDCPVVLVVDGWDRFVEAYGDVGQGRARDLALRVLRDGAAAGVVALLTGDRSLLVGAVAPALPQVWALRLHDPGDLALTGLRRHQVPSRQPPGRAVRTRDGLVAQVLWPGDDACAAGAPGGAPPPEVVSLPTSGVPASGWAVGGDDARVLDLPPLPFLVLGPPGSGVTTALAALTSQVRGEVLRVGPATADAGQVAALLDGFTGTVVVDDAHLLAGSGAEDAVMAWAGRTAGQLLVGAELEASGSSFRGLVPLVARRRTGLVLQPSAVTHGGVLGVRLPVGDRPVPGRGVLVDRGRCTRVQVSRVSPPERPS